MSDRRDKPAGSPTPTTARAWAELVKDLKPGEDPFFYDWRGRLLSEQERSERLEAFRARVGNDRREDRDDGWVPPTVDATNGRREVRDDGFGGRPVITAELERSAAGPFVVVPFRPPLPRRVRAAIAVGAILIVLPLSVFIWRQWAGAGVDQSAETTPPAPSAHASGADLTGVPEAAHPVSTIPSPTTTNPAPSVSTPLRTHEASDVATPSKARPSVQKRPAPAARPIPPDPASTPDPSPQPPVMSTSPLEL